MRGRKPRPIEIASDDLPVLQQIAHSQTRPWYQVRRARILLGIADGGTDSNPGLPDPVRRIDRPSHLPSLRTPGAIRPPGVAQAVGTPDRDFPPCNVPRSSNWPAWSPWPRACTSPTGPARTWLGRPSPTASSRPSASGPSAGSCTTSTCNRTGPATGGQLDLDAQFKQRAEKVLWCYANADRLAEQGYWVVCADEIPNHQVLERHPIRRSIPGSIEQQEFEYTRHGTVNILNFLIVHSGRMEATCVETKDAAHYIEELERFRRRHHHLRGVYLIHDGDPSHTAGLTREYFRSCRGWWRPRFTPAHASWLDQAEILNNAFGYHYLRRGSWTSREEFIAHIAASWPEYNERYAHPFEWTWTNQKMRRWFAEHAR